MKRLILTLVVLCSYFLSINAQDTEYWFSPMCVPSYSGNTYNNNGGFMISNPSNQDAEVVIHSFADDVSDTIMVDARGYYHKKYTKDELRNIKKFEYITSNGTVTTGGAQITSNVPIFVYYIYDYGAIQETVMLKGTGARGTSFHIAHAESKIHHQITSGTCENPYISIIGTEDNTSVTLNLKSAANGFSVGTNNVTINKGQVVIALASAVLKGSVITSDKPIAVTAGEFMGTTYTADQCADQVLRDDYAGTTFVFTLSAGFDYMPVAYRPRVCNYLDMIALENNTQVYINWGDGGGDVLIATLNAGQTFQSDTFSVTRQNACATIRSTKPIHCQQVSGREASVCHLPNFYPTSTNHVSFFSYTQAEDATYAPIYPAVMLAYMQTGKNDFTISYPGQSETNLFNWITANSVHIDSEGDVPTFNGWKYIRFTLPENARNKIITVNNSSSVFQLGFTSSFMAGTNLTYFSSYGRDFQFEHDTVFKCVGTSYTLIGGIADNYEWTLPNGTTQFGPTMSSLTATQEGRYILKMQQGLATVSDTCWVKDIYFKASLATNNYIIGAPFSPSFYLNPELVGTSSIFFEYDWTFGGDATPTTATGANPSVSWPTGGSKNISLKLTVKSTTQTSVNCDTTINVTINDIMPDLPDNIDTTAMCYGLPSATPWNIQEYSIPNYSGEAAKCMYMHSEVLVGDLDGDGKSEILTGSGQGTDPTTGNAVNIYDYHGTFIKKINTVTVSSLSGKYGMAKIKTASGYKSIITAAGSDAYLYAYDYATGTQLWKSSAKYNTTGGMSIASVCFVDFNGDGYTEIAVGNKIFDAETGLLLCEGTGNKGLSANYWAYMCIMAMPVDINGDGKPEILAGNQVYSVNIASRTTPASNSITVTATAPAFTVEGFTPPLDGYTTSADIDLDGYPDAIVQTKDGTTGFVYVWSPHKNQLLAGKIVPTTVNAMGVPLVGDIDGDGVPEIVFMTVDYPDNVGGTAHPKLYAYKYDETTTLKQFWVLDHDDKSGFTGLTLFDFNQDMMSELVWRDNSYLRIVNGSGKSHITGHDTISGGTPVVYDLARFECASNTAGEYPVIADLGEGTRLITSTKVSGEIGRLRIFKESIQYPWAPSRKVWNQYAYNSVNVNSDLTIPKTQFNIATKFTGGDCGTVRPFNAFLMQQTSLDPQGCPIYLLTDMRVLGVTGNYNPYSVTDTLTLNVTVRNDGDAALGTPIVITIYKNSVSLPNMIASTQVNEVVLPGQTKTLTFKITNVKAHLPINNLIARVNDYNGVYPYQPECSTEDDAKDVTFVFNDVTKKTSKVESNEWENGILGNPVTILHGENITYKIKTIHLGASTDQLIYIDTLPTYLNYVNIVSPTTAAPTVSATLTAPTRTVLKWTKTGVTPGDMDSVLFTVTPQSDACASQPLFINYATVKTGEGGNIICVSNNTYHQGGGVAIVTFSAMLNGELFDADPQAVDFKAAVKDGVIIVPDNGYEFIGWSHDSYISMRGKEVPAQNNVMNYDTLMIYGNVELKANFAIANYPIHYYMNGANEIAENPESYTINTGTFTLKNPTKTGDNFVGWVTGENENEIPQKNVTISSGSTGERNFFAVFERSGSEVGNSNVETGRTVWAAGNNLYVQVAKSGSVIKIYNTEGVLYRQMSVVSDGKITISNIPQGVYIITINGQPGQKVRID